jgi:hypothetical protein
MPSRHEKIEALLKEHLPSVPVRHVERPATQFEAQYYEDLVAYRVPMEPTLRERGYVVGRVYMMYGGAGFVTGSDECIQLGKILNRVGLKMRGDSELCKPAQAAASPP